MDIYNLDKTRKLEKSEIDYSKGYTVIEKMLVAHHEAIEAREEISHIEYVKKPSGKIIEKKVVDIPAVKGREAWNEYKDVLVYKLYTEKQLAQREIGRLKQKLNNTDYQAIKYAEGLISEYDYAQIKMQRQEWRNQINRLETILKSNV